MRALYAVLFVLLFPASIALAATIHVPGDQPTIQLGIDAASPGDTVVLAPGTYRDLVIRILEGQVARSVAFLKSGVLLESSHGPEVTIIDGQSFIHCLVGEFLDPSTKVRGVSLVNGFPSGDAGNGAWGGGVLVIDAGPLFENNIFRGCAAVGGGGFLSRRDWNGVGPTLVGNLFLDNEASDLGGGLEISFVNSFLVENNTFTRNFAERAGGGVLVNSCTGTIDRNIFWMNSADQEGGGLGCIGGAGPTTTGSCNLFWVNTAPSGPHVQGCSVILGSNANEELDPRFCNPASDDFTLAANSPGLPENSPCGELIGAFGKGCGPIALTPQSWARVKTRYR